MPMERWVKFWGSGNFAGASQQTTEVDGDLFKDVKT